MVDFITVYHNFNFFLSTPIGELFRRSVELVVFAFATYMIFSEYGRNRNKQLRFLLIGFSTLVITRSVSLFFQGINVFSETHFSFSNLYLPVLNETLELLALILLANSFLFPLFQKNIERFGRKLRAELIILVVLAVLAQLLWVLTYLRFPEALFHTEFSFFMFQLAQLLILLIPIYLLGFYKKRYKYKYSVVVAFGVYAVSIIITIVNILLYNNLNINLTLISYPFPILSVLLFARVIYLKISDKAYLKAKLSETQKKYLETQELSKLKDEFLSMVSHELRTPLTSINLYLGLLVTEKMGRLRKKQKDAITVVKTESSRLSNMINDILTINKLEANKLQLSLHKFDLHTILNDKLYYSLAAKKKIGLFNNVPEPFFVKADQEKFKQIFVNLMGNAIKFTDKGGSIIFSGEYFPGAFIFSITDTGKGMPEEEIAHIFDKFYQVEHILTRHSGGTGLGLAIVKQLVDLHNGLIEVESELGKGTTFTITIPQPEDI